MSLQNLASHVQSAGRGEDKMLVHMTPKEVAGLQTLAAAHGGSLTINPETGLPEAGFLSSLLPTVIGAALAPSTGGASLHLTQAWQTAALVGGAYGLATGSLKKGLMAGLGAYGGASMMPGIMEAGAAAAPITAPSVVSPTAAVPNPGATTLGSGMVNTAPDILKSPLTNQPVGGTNLLGAPTAATAPAPAGGAWPPAAVRPDSIVATSATQGAPSVLAQTGSGIKNLLSDPEKLKAFLGDQKFNLLSSAASAMTDYDKEEEEKKAAATPLAAYNYAPRYAPSARPAGSTAERTYFAADGGLASLGPVENMSRMNAMGNNTNYPMSFQATPTYAMPSERPISQNVIKPPTDVDVDAYTGMPRMAAGGIASLAAGGKTEAQIREEDAAKEYQAWLKGRNTDKTTAKKELDARIKELNKEYTDRINGFNKDTQAELKERQKAVNAEKDKAAKVQMQKELAEWQKSRAAELKGIQGEQSSALKDRNAEYTNRIKELDAEIKERQALRNFENQVFKTGYTGVASNLKASDLTSINKVYGAEVGKQKKEMETAAAALANAKKTGIQSLVDRAQELYNQQKAEYEEAGGKQASRIQEFRESTKRTSALGPRGQYTTTLGDVDAIKKQIEEIKKNPAQSTGMGGATLSADQQRQIKDLESKLAGMSAAEKVYNPKTGQYEIPAGSKFQELKKAPTFGTTKKIMEEDDIASMFEYMAGRRPTEGEMAKYLGKSLSEAQLAQQVGAIAELGAAQKFTDEDLNAQARYYWGRDMSRGELAFFKDPANRITNFNTLRNALINNSAYLQNLNKLNRQAFEQQTAAAQIAAEGPARLEQISSAYQDILGRPPSAEELISARNSNATASQLAQQLKSSPAYQAKMTQSFVPPVQTPAVKPISQEQINQYRQAYMAPTTPTSAEPRLAPLFSGTAGAGGYTFTPPQQEAAIAGALPYTDVINRLGIGGVYSQIAQKAPELQPGLRFGVPQTYTPIAQPATQPMADGGVTALAAGGNMDLGDYSDGGRLLKGPGDGVSDSIPASIGGRRPARLADGEFVIPARIVSELGNGSTEAGARQLYAMMDRVQKRRRKSVGKNKVAVDSKASQLLPA